MAALRLAMACAVVAVAAAAEWGYVGDKANWGETYEVCNGQRQSPIDVKEGDVTKDDALGGFTLTNYDTSAGLTAELSNNGHSAVVSFSGSTALTATGGGLPGTFQAAQFHMHWGSKSSQGSEHLINRQAFPMELHIVHVNTKYASIADALENEDGLAVLGFMYEVGTANSNYNDIVDKLADIKNKDDKASLSPFAVNTLLPDGFNPATAKYFRYPGSLTTPQCQQVVTWTLFTDPIKISENQLQAFRMLLDSEGAPMVDNYRPVQELNSRTVRASFQPDLHWGYFVPAKTADGKSAILADKWSDYYGYCGGDEQSPVDLPKFDATPKDDMPQWMFQNYDTIAGIGMEIENNGHTAKIGLTAGDIRVSGGGLSEEYRVLQMHFHWGAASGMGSEHLVQGKAFPMELHIVHYKASMAVGDAVVDTNDGLAVLGFMFEVSDSDNPAYASIVSALKDIQEPKSKQTINPMRLDSLIPDAKYLKHYYRYSGSLTTPACYQSVRWTVFGKTIPISEAQLSAFRGLLTKDKNPANTTMYLNMVNNYRPVQPLNNRPVTVAVPKWTYFGYNGPKAEKWGDYYPYCNDGPGTRQSPVNIDPTTVHLDITLRPFTYMMYDRPVSFNLYNNGHTVNVNIESDGVRVSGGGLPGTFQAAQFHFHWGGQSDRGSEHLIDNEAFPMEVHIVHWNTKYASIGDALKQPDGLAVLGFMFKVGDDRNPNLEGLVNLLSSVREPKSKSASFSLTLDDMLPRDRTDFYRYDGSLTTPGCFESVTWTLFRNPIMISEDQLNAFRMLKSVETDPQSGQKLYMVDNYRPVQARQGRKYTANFLIFEGSAAAAPASASAIIAAATALSVLFAYSR